LEGDLTVAAPRPVIACVGAGRMGRGIAHCFAYAGHEVRLVDAKPRDAQAFAALAEAALAEIRGTLTMLADLGGFDAAAIPAIMARVSVAPQADAAAALGGARFVFEAVPETAEAKRAALALIDEVADAGAIVASTTSTHLSRELAGLSGRPARFLNAHWLNPAFRCRWWNSAQPTRPTAPWSPRSRRCWRASARCRWSAPPRPATSCRASRCWR
jgi:3-hydroxybutyryl-CoA dehydrogenase